MAEKWEKVLYKRSKYPDNYSAEFLTDLQTNLHVVHYTLWQAILGASKFMCQIDMIVAYFCVFEFVQVNTLNFDHLALLTLLLLAICETVFIIYNFQELNNKAGIYDHIQTALTFVLYGFGFTPIIKTLTTTISTDTIYALSILTFAFSLVFHDYGGTVSIISTPLSINLCLTASVFLISRVESDFNAFFMLSLSVCLFAFWPRIRNDLFLRCEPLPLICIILLGTGCAFAMSLIIPELIALFIIFHLIIVILCPFILVQMQHQKLTVYGPWSEAVVSSHKNK